MEPNETTETESKEIRRGPLDEIETISRKGLDFEDERYVEALRLENERLKRGLINIGLPGQEVDYAMSAQSLGRSDFQAVMEIAVAGIARTAVRLVSEYDRVSMRLEQVRLELIRQGADVTDEGRMQLAEEEKSLSLQLTWIGNLQRTITRDVINGNATLALVKHKIKTGGVAMKRAKPKFQEVGEGVEIET